MADIKDAKIIISEKEISSYREILDSERQRSEFDGAVHDPIFGVAKDQRKCVIIMALSIYNGRRDNVIQYPNNQYSVFGRTEKEYTGAYQLEVIPKYIMNELVDSKIRDVEFIILETEDVHTPKGETVILGNQQYGTDDSENPNPTEAQTFIYKMLKYGDKDFTDNLSKEPCSDDQIAARKKELRLHFVEYHLSDKPRTDMPNLLNLIRRETGFANVSAENPGKQNADIYIDIHGGPRATQQLLTNLLSILKDENITISPDNIFTVDGRDAPITQAGESFRVNDFVSGIHEFVNNGRVKSLEDFYKNSESSNSAKSNALLETMKKVSSAIQLCDMAWFDKLLRPLADQLTEFDIPSNKDDYLYSFLEIIREGYYPLIVKNDNKYVVDNNAVTEIKWCRDKELYQQMLTICESAIPKYLKDKRVIRYDGYLEFFGDDNKAYYEMYNYLFNATMKCASEAVSSQRTSYSTAINSKNRNSTAQVYFKLSGEPAGNIHVLKSQTLREFIALHFKLKDIRNHSVHGSRIPQNNTGSTPTDSLCDDIHRYLGYIDELVKQNKVDEKTDTDTGIETENYIYVTAVNGKKSDIRRQDVKYFAMIADYLSGTKRHPVRNVAQLKQPSDISHDIPVELRNVYGMLYEAARDYSNRLHAVEAYCDEHNCSTDLLMKLFMNGNGNLEQCLDGIGGADGNKFRKNAAKALNEKIYTKPGLIADLVHKPYHN